MVQRRLEIESGAKTVIDLGRRRARGLTLLSEPCDPATCGPAGDPRDCASARLLARPSRAAQAAAQERLVRAIEGEVEGEGEDRSVLGVLAEVVREVTALDGTDAILAELPRQVLRVHPARAAAVLKVGDDGATAVIARQGPAFEVAAWRVAKVTRASREAPVRDGAPSRAMLVPLGDGVDRWALALDPVPSKPVVCERELERLAVLATAVNTALSRARSSAALREAVVRGGATLEAVRDGIIAIDHEGVVRSLNGAAAAALGVRREHLFGRSLREFPALAGLRRALTTPARDVADVVQVAAGEVVVRAEAYEGGVVATLRDSATEQTIAHRMVGSVARHRFEDLVGRSPAFARILDEARRAARAEVAVLIRGESGTGKEMLAQAIHNASTRASGPFLGINVTAIPRELLESELFGYEGGTFTGARASGRGGKFELAGKGTLLLDEIGDMPLEMQGKLLRVLQERMVQRLGSARDIPIRARVVATTHRDLAEAVEAGRFRLDLYHRLRVLELTLPSLRERREDIPLLVEHQLKVHAQETRRRVTIAPRVLDALQGYDWPGNVRELHNVIEGELSVLAPGEDVLTRIPPALSAPQRSRPSGDARGVVPLEEMERRACEGALAAYHGNVARAAEALGVAKGTLYAKMKRYGLGAGAGSGLAAVATGAQRP
ncbi:MAG TPA: sigma 54-interacting transcriptional regulator [Anaeromyxobacteraceae bacterium]|nr:sigma 54-interacting transcriptional regulator [Anaeromyxobacteraceae bacterium]